MRDLNELLEKGSDLSQGAFTLPAGHASLSSSLLILGFPLATPQLCHMAILQPPPHTEQTFGNALATLYYADCLLLSASPVDCEPLWAANVSCSPLCPQHNPCHIYGMNEQQR